MEQTQTHTHTAPSLRKFDCPSCGSSLSLVHPRAKEIMCQYCGSVLDAEDEAHKIIRKLASPERHPPFSFLKVGLVAEFEGKAYQVISRTRWRMRYKEYWREDGESGYSNEVWVYDEWLLIDEDRSYMYLVEDREGFKLSEEIIPDVPMLLPKDLRMSFYKSQRKRQVQEYGNAEVIYFEGESNYQIKDKDQIRFASFLDHGISYLAEWRMANQQEIKEVEFFKETPISKRKILEAFSNNEELERLRQKAADWRFVYQVARLALFAFIGLTLWTCNHTGTRLADQSLALNDILNEQGTLSEPLVLPEEASYQISWYVDDLPVNSEIYVFAYLLDSDQKAINELEGNFSYYTGYDDEGQWTEKSMNESQRFRVDSAGTYYLQFFGNTESLAAFNGRLEIALNQGVMVSRYFFLAMLISLLVMLLAMQKKRI